MTHTRAGRSAASVGRTRRRGIRLISTLAASAVLVTGTLLGSPAPAQADDYPTWADVEAARNNVASTESKVSEVRALISGLEGVDERTQAEAKGNEWQEADTAYQAAVLESDNLQQQADDAAATADESSKRAGQMAAQLARTGGGDLTANLFANAEDADELLYSIGMSGKLSESARSIYVTATQDRNNAQQLNEQAVVARDELEGLKNAAEAAFQEAQAASAAADAALVSEEENRATLEAQLAFLNDESTRTAAEYQEGVEERARIEAARLAAIEAERQRQIEEARRQAEEARRAAEEAARRAAEEAAANPPSSGGGGGGGGGSTGGGGGGGSTGGGGGDFAGVPVASGWVKPASGYVTSSYGGRLLAGSTFHKGTDLSGGGCGGLIYAANSGTVSYAAYGYNGGYGNYITINHGGNVQTAYGHIQPGGILVNSGQNVSAGDVIGLVGDTGFSFGCHLHYEVRLGGATTDPVPYMARQGVYF